MSSREPAAPADVPRTALRSVASDTNPFAELGRYLYTSNPFYLVSAGLVLVTWAGIGLFRLTRGTALEAGADAIAAGLVIFVVAAGISLMKARRAAGAEHPPNTQEAPV